MHVVGRIHSVESLGALDGPGLRFVVFLQGCLFRCRYCHNPDTWAMEGGTERTVPELMAEVKTYLPYMKASGGGVTVSGGEPLLQPEFVAAVFAAAHRLGVNTALDTNGYGQRERVLPALEQTDLVLLDLKQMNPDRHQELTAVENDRVLEFAGLLGELSIPVWIRHVVVPGWTDHPADVDRLAAFIRRMPTVKRVELLPYHLLGKHKWTALGIKYTLEGVEPPSPELMERVAGQLRGHGLTVG